MKRMQGISVLLALTLLFALLAGCAFLPSGGNAADTPAPEETAQASASAETEAPAASEAPEAPPQPAAETADWSAAYREFVLNGGFLSSGQEYGGKLLGEAGQSYDNVRFALYDLDRSGVPELLAQKGGMIRLEMCQYVYTFEDGAVRFLGRVGAYEDGYALAPDSEYHGLFNIWMQMGCGDCSYVTVENGELQVTKVYSFEPNTNGSDPTNNFLFTQVTEDDTLCQLAMKVYAPYHSSMGSHENENRLPMYTIDEISGMGWDAFAGDF